MLDQTDNQPTKTQQALIGAVSNGETISGFAKTDIAHGKQPVKEINKSSLLLDNTVEQKNETSRDDRLKLYC